MCLFDTLDGCFMNFAYDWAFSNPVRKVFYNLTMTGLSVAVAFLIGTVEILGLIGQGGESQLAVLEFRGAIQHQHRRLRHRRTVRRDVGWRPRVLAPGPGRGEVERASLVAERSDEASRSERSSRAIAWSARSSPSD